MPLRPACLVLVLLATGCAPRRGEPAPPIPSDAPAPVSVAPWQRASLTPGDVPAVYLEEWRKAENRQTCAVLAPASLGSVAGAVPRAATFSGGWAVAYDQPELRSAFGVAGAGVSATGPTYDDWPFHREWADGSSAGYGPEGGTGPNQLAYLQIPGQDCLYNVWSRIGKEHLEELLEQLRFVSGAAG